jgi:hypothetical protein
MVEQAGRVNGRTVDAPRWPPVGMLGVAVVVIALPAVLTSTFSTVDMEPPSGSGWFLGAT